MEFLGLVDIPNWAVVLVAVCTVLYIYYTWKFSVYNELGLPGPKPRLIFGDMLRFLNMGMHKYDMEMIKQYGKVFCMYEGRNPTIVCGDPDILKAIMVKDFSNFVNHKKLFLRGILAHSVFDARGERWKFVRNYITPAFSSGKLKKMMPLIKRAAESLNANISSGKHGVDAKELTGAYTMDVIASTGFGFQLDSQKDPGNPFLVNAKKLFAFGLINVILIFFLVFSFMIPVMEWFNMSIIPSDIEDFFTKVVSRALDDRRKETGTKAVDFLQLMVDAEVEQISGEQTAGTVGEQTDRGLTNVEVVSQCFLFLLAGYETTASTLSFIMYHLAVHPDIQERVLTELDQFIPGDDEASYDNVSKLTYMEQCIEETLRIYPPAARLDRECADDMVLKGIKFPAGIAVTIPVYALHMDEDVWPEPHTFDPERFTPEAKSSRNPFYYMPFGMGPRNCIGMRLALLEIKIALATILKNFKFEKSDKTQVPLKLKKSFITQADIHLKVVPRGASN